MKQLYKTMIFAFLTCSITILLIIFPDTALEASKHGLHIWWTIVFPSLLPFFIMAELLLSFGIVKFIGVLFEPIMRPLFKVPGSGSFAWIVGMVSGFPAGAKMSVLLREKGEVTRLEAERLIVFTNAASPLFIFAAIAVGIFHDPKIGMMLAWSHYLANVLVGICMRFYGKETITKTKKLLAVNLAQAFKSMHQTRLKDNRALGAILSDAVIQSVQTLLMIGGFIMLFAVITALFISLQITTFLQFIFMPFFIFLSLPIEIIPALFVGLFEMTMGTEAVAATKAMPLQLKLIVVSFMIGFNGLSIHAQVLSLIAHTDIRYLPYFLGRVLHGLFASGLTLALIYSPFFALNIVEEKPTSTILVDNNFTQIMQILIQYGPIITIFSLLLTVFMYIFRLYRQSA